jgi:hypothetical protein
MPLGYEIRVFPLRIPGIDRHRTGRSYSMLSLVF